jgi:hypothetical protein
VQVGRRQSLLESAPPRAHVRAAKAVNPGTRQCCRICQSLSMTPWLAALARHRHHRRPDRPSSIVAPKTGNHEKGIGDGAAGDLTIESCGQRPLHRLGRSSRSDGIAPPSVARAREGS